MYDIHSDEQLHTRNYLHAILKNVAKLLQTFSSMLKFDECSDK